MVSAYILAWRAFRLSVHSAGGRASRTNVRSNPSPPVVEPPPNQHFAPTFCLALHDPHLLLLGKATICACLRVRFQKDVLNMDHVPAHGRPAHPPKLQKPAHFAHSRRALVHLPRSLCSLGTHMDKASSLASLARETCILAQINAVGRPFLGWEPLAPFPNIGISRLQLANGVYNQQTACTWGRQ